MSLILKHGNGLIGRYFFSCPDCGCKFTACEGDEEKRFAAGGGSIYCPECDHSFGFIHNGTHLSKLVTIEDCQPVDTEGKEMIAIAIVEGKKMNVDLHFNSDLTYLEQAMQQYLESQ